MQPSVVPEGDPVGGGELDLLSVPSAPRDRLGEDADPNMSSTGTSTQKSTWPLRAVLEKYGGRRAMIGLRWLIMMQSFSTGLQRTALAHRRVTRLLRQTTRRRLRTYL